MKLFYSHTVSVLSKYEKTPLRLDARAVFFYCTDTCTPYLRVKYS